MKDGKKKFEFPDVYALLVILCFVAMVLTWIVPAGAFDRVKDGKITKVVAGTFHMVEANRQTPWDVLQAFYQGFINGSATIYMIMFAGAAVSLVEETKTLSSVFTKLAQKLKGKEFIAVAILMYALGFGNATGVFGNIGPALLPIGIVLSTALGGDAFFGLLIIYLGLMSGFSIGFANVNVLGVAQTIAEVPLLSGMGPRVLFCFMNVTFLYCVTMYYYRRIRKDPTYSLNYDPETGVMPVGENTEINVELTTRQLINFFVFLAGIIIMVACTVKFKWNQKKISAMFFGILIVCGIISGMTMNQISKAFVKGCRGMVYAAFMVGFANSMSIILNQGKVIDTIVYFLSLPLTTCGPVLGAGLMMIVNTIINLIIPSGSGQAVVVMPLMTPMADLVGITRQVAVQAFSFGDGLSNLATPLNGPLVGCLAIAGVSFPKYFKWMIKFILCQIAVAFVITMILSAMGWTGV